MFELSNKLTGESKMVRRQTPDQVARRLGVSKGTVIGYCEDGTMPAVNVARSTATRKRWRMSEEDIETFEARRRNSKPSPPAVKSSRTIARPTKDYFATTGGAK